MEGLTPARRVHYFDTRLHRIACGAHGAEHRSTKHARDVNCEACLALLRAAAAEAGADHPAA